MASGIALTAKVVLVGDAKVGKTSILNRWTTNAFSAYYESTVSPELTTKDVTVDGQTVRLQVWDMGFGEPDTTTQFPRFAGGATGAVLFYECSDPASSSGVAHWHQQMLGLSPSCAMVTVGTKSDLQKSSGAEQQKVKAFCEEKRMEHVETSASDGSNVELAFQALARTLLGAPAAGEIRTPQTVSPQATVSAVPNGPSYGLEATPAPAAQPSGAPPRPVKLVLLGEPGVGKSSIAMRLGSGPAAKFQEEYVPTAGPEILTRQHIVSGAAVRLQVWDAAGQDLLSDASIFLPLLQNLDAALIVFDVSSRTSVQSVGKWLKMLSGQIGPNATLMVVGNKTDSVRQVTFEQGQACGQEHRLPYFEFSAKRQTDVSELLTTLLEQGVRPLDLAAAEAPKGPEAAFQQTGTSPLASPLASPMAPVASPLASLVPSPALPQATPAERPERKESRLERMEPFRPSSSRTSPAASPTSVKVQPREELQPRERELAPRASQASPFASPVPSPMAAQVNPREHLADAPSLPGSSPPGSSPCLREAEPPSRPRPAAEGGASAHVTPYASPYASPVAAVKEPRDARDLGPADRTPAATPAAADRAPGSRAGFGASAARLCGGTAGTGTFPSSPTQRLAEPRKSEPLPKGGDPTRKRLADRNVDRNVEPPAARDAERREERREERPAAREVVERREERREEQDIQRFQTAKIPDGSLSVSSTSMRGAIDMMAHTAPIESKQAQSSPSGSASTGVSANVQGYNMRQSRYTAPPQRSEAMDRYALERSGSHHHLDTRSSPGQTVQGYASPGVPGGSPQARIIQPRTVGEDGLNQIQPLNAQARTPVGRPGGGSMQDSAAMSTTQPARVSTKPGVAPRAQHLNASLPNGRVGAGTGPGVNGGSTATQARTGAPLQHRGSLPPQSPNQPQFQPRVGGPPPAAQGRPDVRQGWAPVGSPQVGGKAPPPGQGASATVAARPGGNPVPGGYQGPMGQPTQHSRPQSPTPVYARPVLQQGQSFGNVVRPTR